MLFVADSSKNSQICLISSIYLGEHIVAADDSITFLNNRHFMNEFVLQKIFVDEVYPIIDVLLYLHPCNGEQRQEPPHNCYHFCFQVLTPTCTLAPDSRLK